MTKILFVCMGNICRSPTAEGVFRHHLSEFPEQLDLEVDSAGTHAYHVGEPPDSRSQAAARRRGIDISSIRARKVRTEDFVEYDYILAMDKLNLVTLKDLCPGEHAHKLSLFLDYIENTDREEVPDPYYGGETGFEQVLDLVEAASHGLLRALSSQADSKAGGRRENR